MQGVLVPVVLKVCKPIDEFGLSWFLEGSPFHLTCSVLGIGRSAVVDCTDRSSLDTWFLYHWETGEIFELPEAHTTVSSKRPLDGDVPCTSCPLPASAARLDVNQLASMDEAREWIFRI